jgi:murein DD-endopeptidase MepM/ murein hydrolase activator NlpD
MAIATAVSGRVSDIGVSVVSSNNEPPASTSAEAGYLKPPVIVSTVPGILARHQAEAAAMTVPTEADPAAGALAASETPAPAPQSTQFIYTIQPGDTVDSIAAAFGINPAYILWNNALSDANMLLVGETLIIPSADGILYSVAVGDTLWDIANAFQVPMESIVGYAPNGLASPDSVIEGMVLLLPGAVPPAPPEPEPVYVAEEPYEEEPASGGAPISAGAAVSAPIPAPSYGYSWPAYGNITTYFMQGGHKGIDIDGFGQHGAPIGSAASGQVVLASWSDWGLGYHVIVDHGDGMRTVYGHLSEIWVSPGEYVGQGQAVGAMGSTGYSTGTHLHFEMMLYGSYVDPLAYLS